MKYAIVVSGGKQYKAIEGGTIEVDKLPLEVGTKFDLDEVLMVVDGDDVTVGTPIVSGIKVNAEVVDQFKAKKILVFKYKSRERYRVKQGHRQKYTRLLINSIGDGKTTAKKETVAKVDAAEVAPKAEAAVKTAPKKKAATKTAAKKETAPKKKAATKAAPKKKTATKTAPKKKAATKKEDK